MRSLLRPLLLISVLCATQFVAKAGEFYLKEGDRVVFYGDSITDQRLYTTFTETFVVTRFPRLNVTFVHSGWGGDRVSGGGGGPVDTRLERDVFAYTPTVMTIMLGMNDGSYRNFDQGIFDKYATGYEHIIKSVKSRVPSIRITAILPSPYDDVTQPPKFEGGYNAVLVRYGQFVKELAAREKLSVADLNTPVVAALQKAREKDAELAKKIIPDRVHPGPSGHFLMAAALLQAWNAPATVAAVEIDAAAKRVSASTGTKVSGLMVGDAALSWAQLDAALPMPLDHADPAMALALKSSDAIESLNQQPLKVSGLRPATYTLIIDQEKVGAFSAEELAKGVNLAVLNTPMLKQAVEVHQLTLKHNNLHFTRWRQVEVPLSNQTSSRVTKAVKNLISELDTEEAGIRKQQREKAQPVLRRFELRKE